MPDIETTTRVLQTRIQIRNDTAANWLSVNPVLLKAEIGYETDTGLLKFGDGITAWNNLKYNASGTISLTNNPGATDWKYNLGTTAIVDGSKVWVLVNNSENAAVWKRLLTTEDIEDLGVGDMLKSKFATNAKVEDGYVDKAIAADQLSQSRDFKLEGDVITAVVQFNGTQNVTLNAALKDISELAGGGTFIKVKVDGQGRVIGYETLLASDIPDLTLAKITDAGTAAGKNVGTAVGQVVVVNEEGVIDPSLMPALAITDVVAVADEAAKLALTNVQKGDVAVVADNSKTYILADEDPSVEASWVEITAPLNGIQSINGKTGSSITLNTDDIGEGETNLYYTDTRVINAMKTQASSILTDGASIIHDTDILILDGGNAAGHQ